ncbi:MAG TPA: esterase-like activity of phytase family protein [Gemmatimonadaceae bacterium]
MRLWLLPLATATLAVSACDNDKSTSPTKDIVSPPNAVDAAPTVWGTANGIQISGGYGSALVADPSDPTMFWIMTDRGPNTTTPVINQLIFPIPNFTPTLAKFQLVGDSLHRILTIPFRNAAGAMISGRPNPAGQGATGETGIDASGAPIPTDPDGLDSEGLALAKDGTFWVSDEYGPHIVHFDAMGKTIERINPFGTGTGGRKIPTVFALRRPNRGMEGIAITPDNTTLVGAMQSPLNNPTQAIGAASNANRILVFDIASGARKQYVYETDAVGNYLNEIFALTATTFCVIERDANYQGGSPPAVTKRIYKIDLTGATDVSDAANGANGKLFNGKTLEAMSPAERSVAGIVPVKKTLVYDLLTLPGGYPHDKLEGATLVGSNELVVSNDDDFGIIDGGASNFIPKILPATGKQDRMTLYFIKLASPLK